MKLFAVVLVVSAVSTARASVPSIDRPLIIAHRGASHDAPENTLAAFQLAWEQDADGIEGDFYLTKDGRVVCIHDDTTKRTAGIDLRIADATFDELRQLDVGSWKDKRWASERIPTIEEVFATVPKGKKFYVEIKCGPEIVLPIQRAFAKSGLTTQQVVIISFKETVIAEVKRTIPGVKAIWLVAYQKDQETGQWTPTIEQITPRLRQCRADGLGTEANREVVNEDFVRELRRAEFEFHTWTVDNPNTARYFHSLGVESITTNRPAFLRSVLDRDGNSETEEATSRLKCIELRIPQLNLKSHGFALERRQVVGASPLR
jgi:glycerophosphoryl diester phosphodiesterase